MFSFCIFVALLQFYKGKTLGESEKRFLPLKINTEFELNIELYDSEKVKVERQGKRGIEKTCQERQDWNKDPLWEKDHRWDWKVDTLWKKYALNLSIS